MGQLVTWIVHTVWTWGYLGIFIMMTIESSFIPFPSEIAMIPAGYLSSTGEMNIFIALFSWTLWALLGSSINYVLWYKFGEKVIKKLIIDYGKYFFISEKDYHKAELFFQRHWSFTTLTGRFIPAIRQLISIPAGVLKMNYTKFIIYTWIGAWIWNIVLLGIWYIAWENKQLIKTYSKEATILAILCIVLLSLWYIFYNKLWKSKS